MSQHTTDKRPGDPETTGHEWDGIEEFNNPLPRWWLYTFYLTIIWGIGYTIAFPAWPLINGATSGLLGFSTRAQVAEEIAAAEAANAAINDKLASVEADWIAQAKELGLENAEDVLAEFRAEIARVEAELASE